MNNSQDLNGASQINGNLEGDCVSERKVVGSKKGAKTGKGKKKDIFDEKAEQWSSNKKSSSYYWTTTQNARYFKFLQEYGSLLQLSPEERKRKKVNQIMSKKVKSRNSTQCHTHHQKMMQKYKSIEGILQNCSKQKNDRSNMIEPLKENKRTEVPIEEEKMEMKTASQILAIGSIVVLKDYTYIDQLQYEYSQFHGMVYDDPFNEIDLF